MSELLIVNQNTKEKVLKFYNKTEVDLIQDVELLRKWFETQPHLPEIPSAHMIQFFLINNKFSIEVTKQKMDTYYTVRGLMPNLFPLINPKLERIKNNMPVSYIFPLPKLVDDIYRIFLIKELDVPRNQLYAEGFLGKFINAQEIRLHEDVTLSIITLVDCEFVNMNHTLALTPLHVKMAATILEKVYSNRVKEIHIINHNALLNFFLKMVKAFMKPKIYDRIKLHDSLDSLKKYIPADALPRDYGGELQSLDELQDLWKAKLKDYGVRFDKLDSMKVNEELRPTPLTDLDDYGIQGTFKQLSID